MHFSIELNASNGSLISYYCHDQEENTGGQQVIDREQAQEIAYNFIRKVQPGVISQLKLNENNSSNYYLGSGLNLGYNFHWSRVVNGIPVREDGITVAVDGISAKITNFNFNWNNNVTFPAPGDKLFKPEELTNLVADKLGLYPTYINESNNNVNQTAKLVYKINSNTYFFDAVTGKPVDYNGSSKEFSEAKLYKQTFVPEIGGRAITAESQSSQTLTIEKGQSIAEEFFKKLGYTGKVVRSGGGSESGPGYRIDYWSYRIEANDGEISSADRDVSISIDSSSGRIGQFNIWPRGSIGKSENAISYEQARNTAEKFVQKELGITYPVILQESNNQINESEPYTFSFVRLYNGVPCDWSSIYVGIDRYSGKLVNFHSRALPVSIPKLDSIISPDEADKLFRENQSFELSYTYTRDKNYRPTGNAQLVYNYNNFGSGIDAVNGKLLSRENVNDNLAPFENHWAQGPLRILAENGQLPVKDFDPDNKINRRDSLRILTSLSRYYNEGIQNLNFNDVQPNDKDIQIFKRAVDMGIIENQGDLRPEDSLTREQLAVWLVHCVGYKEMANLPLKIEVPFSDIPMDHPYRNHIAIANAMGIFVGDKDGLFNPQQQVSWAELATVVTRVAPRISQQRYF
nr:S-layer homology domain-containing protein [Desulforamulus aquiferis]